MKIECIVDEELVRKQGTRLYKLRLYTVKADGEVILESLPEYELDDLTIGEIREMARKMATTPNGTAKAAASSQLVDRSRRGGLTVSGAV